MKPQLEFSCPENWNAMTPGKNGRYCSSCEKVVTDFSQMSNEEILYKINSSRENNACGSFKAYQLLEPFNDKRNVLIRFYQRIADSQKSKLPKYISLVLVTALLFLSGCLRRTSGRYAAPPDVRHMDMRQEKHQNVTKKEHKQKAGKRLLGENW